MSGLSILKLFKPKYNQTTNCCSYFIWTDRFVKLRSRSKSLSYDVREQRVSDHRCCCCFCTSSVDLVREGSLTQSLTHIRLQAGSCPHSSQLTLSRTGWQHPRYLIRLALLPALVPRHNYYFLWFFSSKCQK